MLELDIQRFANPKLVIETDLNTKNFENGLDKIKGTTQRAGSTIKSIVAGLGITKAISIAMNQITGSIDGAISRLDTLNNYSKVMSNLGIASEDADKSIKKMSDKLTGLPTTLDQGAMAVQRFTSANGDIAKSTDIFLAFNNAVLAGGANAQIQASALEQMSQAYSKGKMDMMEWRTIQMAMPAQLKQVATAMGVTTDELGQMLREGDNTRESMDQFMDTIVKLNTEGLDGFQNFEQQARNATGGIGTAIIVAKTQIVKGVADIIMALNTRLENTKFGSVAGLITDVGKKLKEGLDTFAKLISGEMSVNDFGKSASNMIAKFISKIDEGLPSIVSKGADVISSFIKGFSQNIPSIIEETVNLITTIYNTIIENSDKIIDAGGEILTKLAEGIEQNLPKIAENSTKIIETIDKKLSEPETIQRISEIGTRIVVSLALGLIKALPNILRTTQLLNGGIFSAFSKTPTEMFKIGRNVIIGFWNGLADRFTWIFKKIGAFAINFKNKLQEAFKIGSPSKLMRDEVGIFLAEGIGVGFEEGLNDVYKDMQKAINLEQDRLVASVETGKVFNTLQNSTPVAISIDADVEMDSQKVGRLVTPTVTRTIKNGGGVW